MDKFVSALTKLGLCKTSVFRIKFLENLGHHSCVCVCFYGPDLRLLEFELT